MWQVIYAIFYPYFPVSTKSDTMHVDEETIYDNLFLVWFAKNSNSHGVWTVAFHYLIMSARFLVGHVDFSPQEDLHKIYCSFIYLH